MYCKKCQKRLQHGCCVVCGTAGDGASAIAQPQKGGINSINSSNFTYISEKLIKNTQIIEVVQRPVTVKGK